jgi:hypothetical protein
MKPRIRDLVGAVAALTMLHSAASATTTTFDFTLPAFFNAGADTPPFPTETIGTFTGLPQSFVVGATISGFFGTPDSQSSAAVELFLDGLLVAQCDDGDACNNGTGIVPWSFTLTAPELALVTDGSATLTGVQTGIGQINIDVTTLALTVAEPANLAWLSLPLIAVAARRRRRVSA